MLTLVCLGFPSASGLNLSGMFKPKTTCARVTQPFDLHWRFTKGDAPGAEQSEFDDASWQKINVPHDWSIEGPFDPNNPTGRGGAYLPCGISWYRKDFSLPDDYAGRRVFIEFDGVMANSDVWINGHHLGKRPFGYSSFCYELTDHINFGKNESNILAVRTDTTLQPDSRWYTGQGIYRHVRMVITDPVHIDHWGVFITTPKVSAEQAVVQIQTTVVNQSDAQRKITVQTTINAPTGKFVESAESTQFISGGQRVDVMQYITVNNPQLWDLDSPNLYEAVSKIISDEVTIDDDFTTFGIRDAHFESATGFWLNGKNIRLNGVCLHHDGGAVGAAVPLRIWERHLELLRQVGTNAIRTAHNPPAPDFLDLCDRMGFLVMDEALDAWTVGKNHAENGYNVHFKEWGTIDLRDMVLRDRNHPCVILYSTGNEIHDTPKEELARKILRVLVDICHKNDPSRPVTQGLFRPNVSHDYDNGLADMLDVIGTNYRDKELLAAHKDKPTRKIVCTEQNHARGAWLDVRDNPQHAGQFIWTGVDYLGEADWPSISSRFGIIDRTGGFYPRTYQRQSWWSDKPMVHIARAETVPSHESDRRNSQRVFSNWTPLDPNDYTDAEVEVYSNCDEVELILNGKSLGTKPKPEDDSPRKWSIPYEAGTIKALGKNNGQIVATHELHTAGKPAKILLEVDRKKLTTDWNEVVQANVTIVDENGIRCPWADNLISFELTGPGKIIAVDNADLVSHESFQGSERHAFRGRCIAILKATAASGKITLTASAPSLESASIEIEAAAKYAWK